MVIGSAIVSICLGAVLILIRWITGALFTQLTEPPTVHDPDEAIRRHTELWGRDPVDVATWLGTPRHRDVEPAHFVAEIERRTGGENTDEGGGVRGELWLQRRGSPTRGRVTIDLDRPDNARTGTFVPVRQDADGALEVAQNLSEDETRRLLLEHRVKTCLMDLPTAAAHTLAGRAAVVEPHVVRPTGRVHLGHVEIVARFRDEGQIEHEVTGFLRPTELALVRRTRGLPVAVDPDGVWRLGTGWY
ncbi:hypothetical protein [Nocardioides jensenii]|uniref:hypothetical protein n=1 Tax=Nocardioides jensenii TaxID=1843 RepID=UPI00082CBD9D|nr:hypothetical protein [Nocardioides jensenii]